jgi:tetratricopeptide (TPR) repeat protein
VAADLGVRYVLEGSVRKGGNRVRITAQLIEAETGHHVWADRFDESGEDIFPLQDAVTRKIVATLGGDLGEIRRGEYSRAWSKPATSLEEYDYFLRGHQVFYGFTREAMIRSREIWLDGLERFPNSGLLRIKVGWTHALSAIFGWAQQPVDAMAEAFFLVDEGLSDRVLPPAGQRYGLWLRATLYLWLKRDPDRALREARAAIDLFPYDSETFAVLAPIPAYAGETAVGEDWMRVGLANEPNAPMIYSLHLGKVLYMAGKYDRARDALMKVDPHNFDMLRYFAASCIALGDLDAARSAAKQILEIAPPLTLTQLRAVLPYRNEADCDREMAHLREAGLPE